MENVIFKLIESNEEKHDEMIMMLKSDLQKNKISADLKVEKVNRAWLKRNKRLASLLVGLAKKIEENPYLTSDLKSDAAIILEEFDAVNK